MKLHHIIEPIDLDDFTNAMSRSEAPLYIPGPADKFADLFTEAAYWDALRLGKRENSPVPRVSMTPYQLPLPYDPGMIKRALSTGSTVCVSHMDRACDALRQLCLEVESRLGFPGTACVHCYNSPPGTGYDFFHVDGGVAITLQIAGEKTWDYCTSAVVPWCTRVGGFREPGRLEWFGDADWQPDSSEIKTPDEMGFKRITLTPGDVFIMPPGVWHRAQAAATSSLSLNLKLTHTPFVDALYQFVRHRCIAKSRWRQPLPFASQSELDGGVPSESTYTTLRDGLRDLGRIFTAAADDDATVATLWFRSFLGSQDIVVPGTDLQLHDAVVLEVPPQITPRMVARQPDNVLLLAQGAIINIRMECAARLVREVLRRRRFTLEDIDVWQRSEGLQIGAIPELLGRLVRSGFIRLVRSTPLS